MYHEVRSVLKRFLPTVAYAAVRSLIHKMRIVWQASPKNAFTKVYETNEWGTSKESGDAYFSGSGSHTLSIAATYTDAVSNFLRQVGRLDAVDLGCGDFAIGAEIRPLCNAYVACDVVPGLITRNRQKYGQLDVDFRVLDITADELPRGDVAFLRQVLQHLSNKHIQAIVPKLETYKYLIFTEHLPINRFVPNRDKPTGGNIRVYLQAESGVVLTASPFNLRPLSETVLCEARAPIGIIRTTLYTLGGRPTNAVL